MRTSRGTGAWSWAGIVAGFAGLATSYALAMALTIRESPVVAVAELVIRVTPGRVVEEAIARLGFWDKPLLIGGILLFLAVLFAYAGRLAARGPWQPLTVWLPLTAVGAVAVVVQRGQTLVDYLPLALGLATWVVVLRLLAAVLRREQAAAAGADATGAAFDEPVAVADEGRPGAASSRRTFLLASGAVALVAAATTGLGRVVGAGRRGVEASRRLLKIDGVTEPSVPAKARIGLDGVSPWMTPNEDFYLIHTAIVVPTIAPGDWSVRIHGMVEREVVLTYADLLERERTEAWVTLNCVSNPVGGNLIGNAWWSGVRLDALLAEAGPLPGADAVKQTSHDGWTCGTPLTALTDGRDAMLAVAMNGKPLPIEHGFPVRTIVPGLYGFVSACKWVVDIEVTRFADFTAYWTGKGWSAQGPVKIASRIDVPRQGQDVEAGKVQVGGVAWHQRTGIDAVEVSLDGGGWQRAAVASVPTDDTWVQWALTLDDVPPGDHEVRVRAIGKDGDVQTGVERDVVPDGATGWHGVEFTARA
ncbi:molybdopterin-dependent oxidoreductase [Nocardioides sp. GCM10027113]|uniref:molybdopterin-dependent oxidoreductase n=1 Tax=unclassified Nocardioides TaxID=2615069 RepID=UPI00361A5691